MQIMMSKGKTFDVAFIGAMTLEGSRVLIDLPDSRKFSEIAADLEGLDTITKTDEAYPGVTEVYEGFTEIVDMHRSAADGSVRLTLKKGEKA